MRHALHVCGGGIVGVDIAGNREPLTRIAVGSLFGSLSLVRRRCSTLPAREDRGVPQGCRAGVLRGDAEDARDEVARAENGRVEVCIDQLEFLCETGERLRPMRRYSREIWRPGVGVPVAEDQLTSLAEGGVIVSDHRVHQEQIHQVAEPFILLIRPRREGHAVQLLRDMEAKRQARQLGWPGNAEGFGQRDRIDPFDVRLTGFRAGDVDAHAGPRLALVRDAELHVHRTVVQQEWLPLSSEREALI
jgi:hypothetical protein